jgi:hypothetical protein
MLALDPSRGACSQLVSGILPASIIASQPSAAADHRLIGVVFRTALGSRLETCLRANPRGAHPLTRNTTADVLRRGTA